MGPEEEKINAQQKTWNEFWGEFLLVTFHKDNPDKWKTVEKKAGWVWKNANLKQVSKVLDLGCGSGMLDIWLAKMGAEVTAIDRIEPVLEAARKEAGDLSVSFITDDIRNLNYPENSFDCILFLEIAGLMGMQDDKELIMKSFSMLKQNGIFIIDCPDPVFADENYLEKETSEGFLSLESHYDKINSIQTITPKLNKTNGSTIELYDPYSSSFGDHKGVKRYLYQKAELKKLTETAGFRISDIEHFWGEKYFSLICRKN